MLPRVDGAVISFICGSLHIRDCDLGDADMYVVALAGGDAKTPAADCVEGIGGTVPATISEYRAARDSTANGSLYH